MKPDRVFERNGEAVMGQSAKGIEPARVRVGTSVGTDAARGVAQTVGLVAPTGRIDHGPPIFATLLLTLTVRARIQDVPCRSTAASVSRDPMSI